MANFRGKIQTDLGLSKFSQYRPVGRMRADISAKPVLDSKARMFEALGSISPMLMKLAEQRVSLEKEEIQSEEQRAFDVASAEERRRFAEGEALEEEKSNPIFAGSNPWRRVIRQEIAGKHAAEVRLLSELENRSNQLSDQDRDISDIDDELNRLASEFRPTSLYGGRAYDRAASQVIQQNRLKFLGVRARKQEAATAEAIQDEVNNILLQAWHSGEGVNHLALHSVVERYRDLTGLSGRDFVAKAVKYANSQIADYAITNKDFSIEDAESAMQQIAYAVAVVDGSQDGSYVEFSGSSEYSWSEDPDTGEQTPPSLGVYQVSEGDTSVFVVAPDNKSKEEVEEMVSSSPVNAMPRFVTREKAEEFAGSPEKKLRKNGNPARPAKTTGELTNTSVEGIEASLMMDASLQRIKNERLKEQDSQEARATNKINNEIMPLIGMMLREGKTEPEIMEVITPMFESIGQEYEFGPLTDANLAYEQQVVRDYVAAELRGRGGVSFAGVYRQTVAGILDGTITADELPSIVGLGIADAESLLPLAQDPDAYFETQAAATVGQNDRAFEELLKSTKLGGRDPRLTDLRFVAGIYEKYVDEIHAQAIKSIKGPVTPESFAAAVSKITRDVTSRLDILDQIVAEDVRPPDANLDAVGLLRDENVKYFLSNAFVDLTRVDFDSGGNMTAEDPNFWPAMVKYSEEYWAKPENVDKPYAAFVADFISKGDQGFEAYYRERRGQAVESVEVAAIPREEMTPEQAQLFEERAAEDMRKREEIVARRKEAVEETVGGDVDVPSWRPSEIDKEKRFREGIPKLREELRAVDENFERSKAYRDNDLVIEYKRARNLYQASLGDSYERISPDNFTASPASSVLRGLYLSSDERFQEVIDEGETDRPFFGRAKFNYGHIVVATLRYRLKGGLIDGEPSHLTAEELATGMLRFPHREVKVPVPRAELHPHKYIMVADKDQLDSYTDEDWISLYENLDPTVQADLDNFVEMGAADNIPELLKGMQEDLLYRLYRIDLEDNQRTGPSKQMQGGDPKEDPERLRMLNGLEGREIGIVEYHEDTIRKGLVGRDEEGRPVTVLSMGVTIPEDYKGEPHPLAGKYVLIPGYNKKTKEVMKSPEAYKLFEDEIFEGKWPTYDSAEELDERSKVIHEIMDYDADHLLGAK